MYSFVSSNDFDHKTVYVSDWTSPYDAATHYGFPGAPLEPVYLFDDLYERYRNEIEYAHLNGTSFQSGNLIVGKYCVDESPSSSTYYYLRLTVSANGTITIQYAVTSNPTSSSTRWSGVSTCTKEEYQLGGDAYYRGHIYIIRQVGYSDSGGPVTTKGQVKFIAGKMRVCIGTWKPNAGNYGQMFYSWTDNYVLPTDVPIMTEDQLGTPSNDSAALANQPEILVNVPWIGYMWSPNPDYRIVSFDGSYDPDPTPPTPPGPGPGGSDPNYDPNVEPGDNPDPSPGPHNRQYDPIPIPGLPTVTAVGAGFTTLYRPSEAILRLLASELYSDNAIQIISNFFSDPYDMIAGLSIVPFAVPVSGRAKHRIGLFESNIAMDVISNQFVVVNCGDILIEKYYNSFMDYAPYTRLILWLPYIGYQEIDPDEVMGDMLNVTYHCDCLSGACTAFVNTGVVGETGPQIPRVIAQFSGNCNIQVPTAAASYDNLIASSINILTTAAGTYLGAVSGIASMAAGNSKGENTESAENSIANQAVHGGQSLIGCAGDVVRSMKPGVIRNGTPGSSAGYMGVQTPYLIKIVPRSSIPDDGAFMAIKGYPSNKVGTLSEYSGFCIVEDIQLNNVPATIGEINEIYDLLKGGVIL